MDKILKDASNQILVDNSGNILKERPFNETTTTNGKIAEYVSGNYENVSGFCRTWYDSVGGNNLTQTNATYQPTITSDLNGHNAITFGALLFGINMKSCYIVFKNSTSLNTIASGLIMDSNIGYLYSGINNYSLYSSGGLIPVQAKANNITYNTNDVFGLGYVVLYLEYASLVNLTIFGSWYNLTAHFTGLFIHFTVYNKINTASEIIYNTNALRQKYSF